MKHPSPPLFSLLLCTLVVAGCGKEEPAGADPFDAAMQQVSYGAFDQAAHFFAIAAKQAPRGSDRYIQSHYGQAASVHQTSPSGERTINEAAKLYKQVIAEAPPDSIYAARAMIGLGRIAEVVDYHDDPQNLPDARKWYRQVMQQWPKHFLADEAAYRLASAYVQTYNDEDVQQGVKLLLDWLNKNPPQDNLLASAMWQYLGDTYLFPLNDYPDAVAAYVRAADIGLLEQGREGPIYWKTAVLADRLWRRLSDDIPPRLGGPGQLVPPAPDQGYQPPARYHGPVGIENLQTTNEQKQAARDHYRAIARRFYEKVIVETPKSGKAYDAQQRLTAMGYEPPPIPQFALAAQQAMAAARAASTKPTPETQASQPAPAKPPALERAWLNVPPGFTGPDSPPPITAAKGQ